MIVPSRSSRAEPLGDGGRGQTDPPAELGLADPGVLCSSASNRRFVRVERPIFRRHARQNSFDQPFRDGAFPTILFRHDAPLRLPFVVSAVFHYLGPAFAVLLFVRVDVLGVAWLRIAAAALVFALWRRPWHCCATAT